MAAAAAAAAAVVVAVAVAVAAVRPLSGAQPPTAPSHRWTLQDHQVVSPEAAAVLQACCTQHARTVLPGNGDAHERSQVHWTVQECLQQHSDKAGPYTGSPGNQTQHKACPHAIVTSVY